MRCKTVVVTVVVCCLWAVESFASEPSCSTAKYALNYTERQLQYTERRLLQQQNAYYNLQNRIEARVLSLQFQVDRAVAQRQTAAGISAGNGVGCAIRSIFWGRRGGCFANSVAQAIRLQSRANALYRLAVSRLTWYQNASASQLARTQQRVALYQLQYDTALERFREAETAYFACVSEQNHQVA